MGMAGRAEIGELAWVPALALFFLMGLWRVWHCVGLFLIPTLFEAWLELEFLICCFDSDDDVLREELLYSKFRMLDPYDIGISL